jgi:hypothetical protein
MVGGMETHADGFRRVAFRRGFNRPHSAINYLPAMSLVNRPPDLTCKETSHASD